MILLSIYLNPYGSIELSIQGEIILSFSLRGSLNSNFIAWSQVALILPGRPLLVQPIDYLSESFSQVWWDSANLAVVLIIYFLVRISIATFPPLTDYLFVPLWDISLDLWRATSPRLFRLLISLIFRVILTRLCLSQG